MRDEIAEHFAAAVMDAEQLRATFGAFRFRPFAPWLIEEMRAFLPEISECRHLAHIDAMGGGRPNRYAKPLPDGCPIWDRINEALCSSTVRDAMSAKLGLTDLGVPRVAVLRDLPGFKIRVHPDHPTKIATAQIYLAANREAPDIGLRFYRRDGEGYQQTGMCPYLPGWGYFFARSDESFHAVEPTTVADGIRDSLMLVYFRNEKGGFV